jgi:hypothetical protein
MTREIFLPRDEAYVRNALFGIELLDAVTLARVSGGVKVTAEGLHAKKPVVSAGGVFAWFREDFTRLQKVTIDPQMLPYEIVELEPAQLQTGLNIVELAPRLDYPFAAGITGLRGLLIEERVVPAVPVPNADVRPRWLDENAVWRDAPTEVRTGPKGDFVAFLRLTPADVPQVDPGGIVTVRLRVRRGASQRESADKKLPQGRIADPSTFAQGPNALIFAWDELQP